MPTSVHLIVNPLLHMSLILRAEDVGLGIATALPDLDVV